MEKKDQPENGCTNCGKHADEPVTAQQELLTLVGTGWVCQECLNEDFDTCVCPEPEK
jgi:hypothetical protein